VSGGTVLSVDELAAAARTLGLAPPAMFHSGWSDDDRPVADTVALKCLLARGLAQVRDENGRPAVGLTTEARALLTPLLTPTAVVSVETAPRGRLVVAEVAETVTVAEERQPSLWYLTTEPGPAESVAAELVPVRATPPAAQEPLALTPGLSARLDHHLLAGDGADALARTARRSGMSTSDADRFALVVAAVEATTAVSAWRRSGPDQWAGGTVRWLDAGPYGLWMRQNEPPDDCDGSDEDVEVLLPVPATDVEAALRSLLRAEHLTVARP